jgi:hypothetical protein
VSVDFRKLTASLSDGARMVQPGVGAKTRNTATWERQVTNHFGPK